MFPEFFRELFPHGSLLTLITRMAESLDFDGLVTAHYEKLYQFAFSLTRSEAEACDLVQQTFCIWAEKCHQLRDISKVKTWLFTTLHREFLGVRRKQHKFVHVEVEQMADELPVVAPPDAGSLDAPLVLKALAKLDELYQAPVALFAAIAGRILPRDWYDLR